jgi:hypothetical protein
MILLGDYAAAIPEFDDFVWYLHIYDRDENDNLLVATVTNLGGDELDWNPCYDDLPTESEKTVAWALYDTSVWFTGHDPLGVYIVARKRPVLWTFRLNLTLMGIRVNTGRRPHGKYQFWYDLPKSVKEGFASVFGVKDHRVPYIDDENFGILSELGPGKETDPSEVVARRLHKGGWKVTMWIFENYSDRHIRRQLKKKARQQL